MEWLEFHGNVTTQAELALASIIEGFSADGYSVHIRESSGDVIFEVVAGPDACPECLTPPQVMGTIIGEMLREHGITGRLDLRYPH